MQSSNPLEKANQKLKNSLTFRLIAITILVLLLLIPTVMVKEMIHERQRFLNDAVREVSQKWGHAQTITGPVLNIPFIEYNDEEKTEKTVKIAHFLPENLNIDGKLIPHKRHRGIYNVIVYESNLALSGNFNYPDFSKLSINPENVLLDQAFISTGISDLRGIQERILLSWNQDENFCSPGIPDHGLLHSGVSNAVKLDSAITNYSFRINLELNGSQMINFQPLGKETKVKLSSSWADPKFDGEFLPDTHQITDKGFTAQWKILHLNRGYPQQWIENTFNLRDIGFGVELITPVDTYQKSMRTIKYAILVIALTFLIFFFSELRSKKKVHPLQYILVGLALVLFYSLLVSLSEHLLFGLAFMISALAIMLLIAFYSGFIFRSLKSGITVFAFLAVIYAFIYALLQLESYALLAGNIGLFIILGIIMWVSRKMNWLSTTESE